MSTLVPWLLTRSLRSVRHDDDTDEWVFDFGEGYVLQAASPWRLVNDRGIAMGHCDHRQQFGLPEPVDAAAATFELVKDHIVVDAVAADGTADLLVDFDEGIRLEVFNNSSGFEGLVLNGPDGRMFVAQGGGKLSEWKADAQIEANRTDWRLQGQERYLKGATLIHREYRRFAENRDQDHDHCEFCAAKFTVEALPDTLQEGYATLDDYRWVCSTCFEDFKEMFGWTVHTRDADDA